MNGLDIEYDAFAVFDLFNPHRDVVQVWGEPDADGHVALFVVALHFDGLKFAQCGEG